jgi:hypothetical protein
LTTCLCWLAAAVSADCGKRRSGGRSGCWPETHLRLYSTVNKYRQVTERCLALLVSNCRYKDNTKMSVIELRLKGGFIFGSILVFVCPCIDSIIRNYDQQMQYFVYLFVPNHLYMFRAMFSPIIRSTWLYLQNLLLSTDIAAGCCHGWDGTAVPSHPWQQTAAT